MSAPIRLDEVSVFGDTLRFLIPHEWVEGEEEGDHYLYHAPDTDSGWLRVSLITVKTVELAEKRLQEMFGRNGRNYTANDETGNLVEFSEKDSEENGVPIHIYYWKVASAVPPDLIREAVFSYTVLANRRRGRNTRRAIDLIGKLASQAVFA